jgi:eukaryotic-like serine/threonine-protein kinase
MEVPDERRAALPGSQGAHYWALVQKVFAEALEASEEARTAVLDVNCGDRNDLRAEVESLLDAHGRGADFITPITFGGDRSELSSSWHAEDLAGTRVGAFRLLERVGSGGMGEVYRAERVEGEFTQRVAVKLMGTRFYGSEAARRFRAERQILASLQHPNIVGLVDGGVTGSGQPFIVMEYVDGLTVTDYCRRHAVALEGRLRLFLQVTSAAAYAHRRLVVHRDFKPGNVLVTGDGIVKVLDFGVAKLLESQEAPAAATVSLLGPMTPDYASPEQLRGLPVTTACDVYTLGVLLYELVAGRRPYDTKNKTIDDVRSIVIDREPPPPSAAREPGSLRSARRLTADLDAIVLKAMAKDPERRYSSAGAFGEDVTRLLEGQPVAARKRSFVYLARKTLVRYRTVFSVAAILLVLLVAALGGAVWQTRLAMRERERAVRRFNEMHELATALVFRVHDDVASLVGSTPVRRTIIAEGLRLLERLEQDAAGDRLLQLQIANAYLKFGHVQGRPTAANLGDREGAIRSYRRARDLSAPFVTGEGAEWNAVWSWAEATLALAAVLPPEEAQTAAAEVLASARSWQSREPDSSRTKELLARAHFWSATLAESPASLPHWLETARLFEAVLAEDSNDLAKIRNVGLAAKYLATYYEEAGDLDKALEHYQRAASLDERRLQAKPNDPAAQLDLALDIGGVANIHMKRKDHAAAIETFKRSLEIRERLAAADPKNVYAQARVAYAHTKLATVYGRMKQLEAGRTHARRAITIYEPLAGVSIAERHGQMIAMRTLAEIESDAGRRQLACATYRKGRQLWRAEDERHATRLQREEKTRVEQLVAECALTKNPTESP